MDIKTTDPIHALVRLLAKDAAREHLSEKNKNKFVELNQNDNKKPPDNVIDLKKVAS